MINRFPNVFLRYFVKLKVIIYFTKLFDINKTKYLRTFLTIAKNNRNTGI